MSLLPLSLVIFAAFIHATWNLLSKRAAAAGAAFVFAYNVVACVVYLPWMVWLLVYGELTWSLPIAACLVLSAVIHLAYSLCLQRGYQVADLSVVYPIARGTGPMLSSIGAFIVSARNTDDPGHLRIARCRRGDRLHFHARRSFRIPSATRPGRRALGTATGSLIAGYTVVDGFGVKVLGIHPVVLDWVTNLVRFFILAPIVLSNWARAKER